MSSNAHPKQSVQADTDEIVGTVLADRYRVDRLLGEGGMGKVYAAEHVLMRKKLAIKILRRELCSVSEVIARFEREAMATANIDHPNIAAATDFGRLADGSLFLALEFVEGRSLRDEIIAGPMPVERALHIARQIALALSAAHALGIVHRDLKPENVMLVTKGSDPDFVKVLDFGVAKVPLGDAAAGGLSTGPLTKAGVVFGTPEYMAPEQALAHGVDGRADLYALGVIVFEMLCGMPPFTSKSEAGILGQQLAKPAPSIAERAPGVRVPARAEQVVMKLLVKEAGGRFQTADELVQALDELLQPPRGPNAQLFTRPVGSPTAFLGSPPQVPDPSPQASPVAPRSAPLPPRPVPPRPSTKTAAATTGSQPEAPPPLAASAKLEAVVNKPSFSPSEPLPAFTFPALGEQQVQELSQRVAEARAATSDHPVTARPPAGSSLEAVISKPSFSADEPLPAFTFPALDEQHVQELSRRVAQTRASARPMAKLTRAFALRSRQLISRLQKSELGTRALRGSRVAWERARALARRWIAAGCRFIDDNRSRLPTRIRNALRNVRAGVILAVLTGFAWGALLLAMLLVIGLTHSKAKAPTAHERLATPSSNAPKPDPVLHEIEEAKKQGQPALEKLAERHPKHPRVWLELAASRAKSSDYTGAVAATGKALDADAKANADPLAAEVLATAVRQPNAGGEVFTLLEQRMGADGAAVLYDLSIDPKAKRPARTRAEIWVRSDEFKKVASPDVEIAAALRYSKSCAEKHSLLARAAEVGMKRALDHLNVAKVRGGCGHNGRSDCFPCLRRDDALEKAIAAIEKRLGQKG